MKGKFKIPTDHVGMAPIHFKKEQSPTLDFVYTGVTRLSIIYETDIEKLAAYIPEDLELLSNKVIVTAVQNDRVQVYGERAYNLICVLAQVAYGDMKGTYTLTMWENSAEPMTGGRELWGVPKTISDIDDIIKIGDNVYCGASYNTYNYCKMKAVCPQEAPKEMLDGLNTGEFQWSFNVRYLPDPTSIGASYAELIAYASVTYDYDLFLGKGTVEWTVPEAYQFPQQRHIIQGVADLPILSEGVAMYAHRDSTIKCGESLKLKRYI